MMIYSLLGFALLTAGVVVFSLYKGRVPARWPMPSFDRRSAPTGFWLTIASYTIGIIITGLVAITAFR